MTQMIVSLYRFGGAMNKVDVMELGPTVMEWYARSLQRGLTDRQTLPQERFTDYSFDNFVSDPLGTVEKIYRHFNLPVTAAVRRALEAHMAAHPQNKHGLHQHKLAQFGITEEQVRERFAFYLRDNPLISM